jgi:hypothetical protein
MGPVVLIVAALLVSGQAGGAGGQPASSGQAAAPAGQKAAPGGASSSSRAKSTSQDTPALELPVSLEHIRAALARAPEQPRLLGMDRKPDFQVTVEERLKLEELLWSLEYKTGPAPPGGLYAYEQQRLLWNKTDHPLVQPYAAFNSSQLVTLAVEGIVEKYAGGAALHALTGAERRRAEAAARTDVKRAIADFCAAQSDRSHIEICWMGIDR